MIVAFLGYTLAVYQQPRFFFVFVSESPRLGRGVLIIDPFHIYIREADRCLVLQMNIRKEEFCLKKDGIQSVT